MSVYEGTGHMNDVNGIGFPFYSLHPCITPLLLLFERIVAKMLTIVALIDKQK